PLGLRRRTVNALDRMPLAGDALVVVRVPEAQRVAELVHHGRLERPGRVALAAGDLAHGNIAVLRREVVAVAPVSPGTGRLAGAAQADRPRAAPERRGPGRAALVILQRVERDLDVAGRRRPAVAHVGRGDAVPFVDRVLDVAHRVRAASGRVVVGQVRLRSGDGDDAVGRRKRAGAPEPAEEARVCSTAIARLAAADVDPLAAQATAIAGLRL